MWKDPIVEEIHAIREQIAQECDYDIKQIIARLRKHEKEHPDRLTAYEPDALQWADNFARRII